MKVEKIKGAKNKNGAIDSLAETAYKKLEEMIVTLELQPGCLLSEKELSDMLDIGRMPVREAIKKLELDHLLTVMPRRGIKVTELRLEDVNQQMEVRAALERVIARAAARKATAAERKKFIQLADAAERAAIQKDHLEAVRVDNEFNRFVSKCARNLFASSAIAPLHALSRRLYYYQYSTDDQLTRAIDEGHANLMRAIAAGEEDKAERLSDELMALVERLYKLKLEK